MASAWNQQKSSSRNSFDPFPSGIERDVALFALDHQDGNLQLREHRTEVKIAERAHGRISYVIQIPDSSRRYAAYTCYFPADNRSLRPAGIVATRIEKIRTQEDTKPLHAHRPDLIIACRFPFIFDFF